MQCKNVFLSLSHAVMDFFNMHRKTYHGLHWGSGHQMFTFEYTFRRGKPKKEH